MIRFHEQREQDDRDERRVVRREQTTRATAIEVTPVRRAAGFRQWIEQAEAADHEEQIDAAVEEEHHGQHMILVGRSHRFVDVADYHGEHRQAAQSIDGREAHAVSRRDITSVSTDGKGAFPVRRGLCAGMRAPVGAHGRAACTPMLSIVHPALRCQGCSNAGEAIAASGR
jgi:hypothetical protein